MTSQRGKFIVFEGSNLSGKTSIIQYIVKELNDRGLKVKQFEEPHKRLVFREMLLNDKYFKINIGKNKDELNDIEINYFNYYSFMASRVITYQEIFQLLCENVHIILDRSFISTMVYQKLLIEQAFVDIYKDNKILFKTIANSYGLDMELPDLLVYLYITPETFLSRKKTKLLDDFDHEDTLNINRAYQNIVENSEFTTWMLPSDNITGGFLNSLSEHLEFFIRGD